MNGEGWTLEPRLLARAVRYFCPDCGNEIERTDSGAWWRHVHGCPTGDGWWQINGVRCWRLSMDGPCA